MMVMDDYVIPVTIDEIAARLRARMDDECTPEVFCPYCNITFLEYPDDGFSAVDELALSDHMDDVHTEREARMFYQALDEVTAGL